MATRSRTVDKYSNMMVKSISMSAANTLSFDEVDIGLSLFDKVGLQVQRIEYTINKGTLAEMTAANDTIEMALTTNDGISAITTDDRSVIHMYRLRRLDAGTAGNAVFFEQPVVFDFSSLSGGGLLITPRPLYVAMDTSGLASAGTAYLRIFFTVVKLQDSEYFELLETRHYFGQ